ncbi:MAG TPA: rhomboid family intramembrane serine protease [Candidatus Limnocylindrales bacterium]|nr:rhomboid family intramembrane serine protease [Candidatus Limnocylindrales bacterium]
MIPLRDANPIRRTPIVTIGLIVACVVAFAYSLGAETNGGPSGIERLFFEFGLIPAQLLAEWDAGLAPGEETLTVFSSMFLHANLLHLGGNMLYLWIFGNNIEDRFGRPAFVVFYLLGGVAAAAAQVAIEPGSEVPMIGASGAVSAVLGAYLVLFPRARILSLVFLGFFYQLIEVPALVVLGLWFLLQLIDGIGSLGLAGAEGGGVAFFAHIGGFIAGVVLAIAFRGLRTGRPLPSSVG